MNSHEIVVYALNYGNGFEITEIQYFITEMANLGLAALLSTIFMTKFVLKIMKFVLNTILGTT